jgi:hypothetical protein
MQLVESSLKASRAVRVNYGYESRGEDQQQFSNQSVAVRELLGFIYGSIIYRNIEA